MPLDWNEFRQSAFFSWFHLREIERLSPPAGAAGPTVIRCRPESSGNELALAFEVGLDGRIERALLSIDRSWADAPRTAPFAADIVKSFIMLFSGEDTHLIELAGEIERQMGSFPGVISRAGAVPPPALLTPEMQAAVEVIRGRRDVSELPAATGRLRLSNTLIDSGYPQPQTVAGSTGTPETRRLRILWTEVAAPPPHPFSIDDSPPRA